MSGNMLERTFRGRKVLVTGHTGFKGGWLSIWLTQLGARVSGYALRPPTNPSLFQLAGLRQQVDHTIGDVRDLKELTRLIRRVKPEFVFHLAAQPLVRRSYAVPVETFQTNVIGTGNVLEAVRIAGCSCTVVAVTTDKCYENREWIYGYRETDPLGGYDPYSASKACAELVVSSWRRSFFMEKARVRLSSARAGNVIGGGDWAKDRIMTDCVSALVAGRPVSVRNPGAVRPWQHVLEPLSGYLCLAAAMAGKKGEGFCDAWNFGPDEDDIATVGTLMGLAVESWGSGAWKAETHGNAPHEAEILSLCCDKAKRRLSWRPVWGLERTVTETMVWYRRWHEGHRDLLGLCRDQVSTYTQDAADKGLAWTRSR